MKLPTHMREKLLAHAEKELLRIEHGAKWSERDTKLNVSTWLYTFSQ